MAPVIRVDDQVMDKLKEEAKSRDLVFEPPNTTLRAVLGLDQDTPQEAPSPQSIEIELKTIYTPRKFALIPIHKDKRTFFPGYKVNFQLSTDTGTFTTHVTSASRGTPIGDPKAGGYIQGGLRSWYDKHMELKDGARLKIKALHPGKHYELSIVRA